MVLFNWRKRLLYLHLLYVVLFILILALSFHVEFVVDQSLIVIKQCVVVVVISGFMSPVSNISQRKSMIIWSRTLCQIPDFVLSALLMCPCCYILIPHSPGVVSFGVCISVLVVLIVNVLIWQLI